MPDHIKHFSHEHELYIEKWISLENKIYTCTICNGPISVDENAYFCYICCSSLLHKTCAKFPQHITSHSLHTLNHSLTLAKRSFNHNNNARCYYCEKPFSGGDYHTYTCDQCPDFQMHATCGAIPLPESKTSGDGAADDVVRYACHQRPMTILRNQGKGNCFACQSPWSGEAYSCMSNDCENFLHKPCGDRLRRRIQHPFHPHHPLELQVSKPRICHSCLRKDCRLVFSCRGYGCSFVLCTECAHYSTARVQCQSHDHSLCLVEKTCYSDIIRCDACQTSYKNWVDVNNVSGEVSHTRSLFFRCLERTCYFNLHFLCGPLPVQVKYEYHIHPLTLVNGSAIEDGIDEYYCDACEKERDLRFRVYYCAECKYVAHIHCVMSEMMKMFKADTTGVRLKALGENRWDDIDTEETEEFTMQDIFNTLTEPEKQTLTCPYDRDHVVAQRLIFLISNQPEFQIVIRTLGSPEDFSRLQRLLSTGEKEFRSLTNELRWFAPEEGLTLEGKYLRQKVIDVRGYLVPKTLAPILATLLRKYGDLGGHSGLTPGMKSVASTFLCLAIGKMCETKVENITAHDLKHLWLYIHGVHSITGFDVDRYLRSLEKLTGAFLGFEAIRLERDAREKLTSEFHTLVERIRRYEESRQKLEACASKKSEVMECLSNVALEWKGKYWGDNWF